MAKAMETVRASRGKLRDRYLDALGLEEGTLVHFDIREADPGTRWALHRFLHGRVERRVLKKKERVYRYPGLLHEGGVRIGQSVYLLPPNLGSRLIVKLRELKIQHETREIYVQA
jgi:hypothetical protein